MSIGIAATGLASYAYFSLASHSLAPADYGRITLLWSAVFITASILYRPVEQLLSRSIADHDARGVSERRPLRIAAQVQLVLALAFAVAALALRAPLEDGLFGGSQSLFWIMVATVLAYAASYYARGVLAGRRRFRSYGALLLLESGTRVLFPTAVAVGLASGASFVAIGLVVGPTASLAVVTGIIVRALRRSGAPALRAVRDRRPRAARDEGPAGVDASEPAGARAAPGAGAAPAPDAAAAAVAAEDPAADGAAAGSAAEPELTLAHGTGYAGAVLAVMACEQTFLSAGPILINATEAAAGAALAGFAFNALLIVRAPVQLFQAVQASILPHLARLRAGGHADPFQRSVAVTLAAVALFAAVATVSLLAVGPSVMRLLFGADFDYGRGGLALMGIGMGLYLAASTLTQAALARGQAARAAKRWGIVAVGFVAVLLVPVDDRVLQVEAAFAAGAALLCAALYALYRRGDGGEERR